MVNQADVTGCGGRALDIWHVRLPSGETRALSLDDLDAAFQAGWIDERTPVLAAGAVRWAPLAEVAGLDETPPPVAATPSSLAPLAFDAAKLGVSAGSESRVDVDAPMDAEADAELRAMRPRLGRKILGSMILMMLVAGIGVAGVRARPAVERAIASRGGGHAAQAAIEGKPQASPPAAPLLPAPPAPSTVAISSLPTMSAAGLPDAPAAAAPRVPSANEKKAPAVVDKKAAAAARRTKRASSKAAK